MPTLTTDKIIAKLNSYFTTNQYVFWYDEKGEFKDIIGTIADQLTSAKLYQAQANQQFKTKIDLLKDSQHKYLIYATYKRPKIQENYLTDMEHYSKLFTADATQIILEELNLPEEQLYFVKQHSDYFGAKSRRADFVKYWSDAFAKQPEKGTIAAITKTEKLDMNELLMKVIAAGSDNNHYVFLFTKYGVLDAFWKIVMNYFGGDENSEVDLNHLVECLFITYLSNELEKKLPSKFGNYYLERQDNVQIFIDRFADSNKYQQYYDDCSTTVWHQLNLAEVLKHEPVMILTKISIFEEINHLILAKLVAKFDGKQITDYEQILETIDQMLDRTRNNYSGGTEPEYKFLRYAAELLNLKVPLVENWHEELADYLDNGYQIDTIYRKSLLAYTDISNTDNYVAIKKTLDLYYGNILLDSSVKQWNDTFDLQQVPNELRQERFYHNHVRDVRERVVVIFSDALRYEVAKELEEELNSDDRLTMKMNHALTVLPSVTYMGMNVMLPHHKLEWDAKANKVRVDGANAENTENRDKILKSYDENNLAFQLKNILEMSSKEIKQLIVGKNVIYLYHNQIDAKGHELKTTRELVEATEKAIAEIKQAVQVLRTNGIAHIIITADHGFIYQEKQIQDTDKIDLHDQSYVSNAHLRYLIIPNKMNVKGVKETTLGVSLNNDDSTNVYYPMSPNEFVAKSGSKNYVHGGSSIQEMLIPVLDIKASSRRSVAQPAQIKLAATTFRINNLKMNLLFNQTAPISDTVLPAEYHAYFTDEDGKLISNNVTIEANRTGSAADRTIAITITMQDAQYGLNKKYYLVIEREGSEEEPKKFEYRMDLVN
ncbi:BREX-1 system phosphatase PglZ type A [Lactobacillus kefiranofaciens]|nr:BREX-1 system phosphatase PglZ type A [Lactobacillus kefiranofaciens]